MNDSVKFKKQKGQFMLEGILLMVLFLGVATVIKDRMTDTNVLGSLVAGPWERVSGMMTNGVWRTEAAGVDLHPQGNVMSRVGDSP